MDVVLSVILESDVKAGVKGMDEFAATLDRLSTAAASTSAGVNNSLTSVTKFGTASTGAAANIEKLTSAVTTSQTAIAATGNVAKDSAKNLGVSLGSMGGEAQKAASSVNSLTPAINGTRSAMKILETQAKSGQLAYAQYGVAAGKAVSALSDLRVSAPNATIALMNLGRVAQDAPFGFIGIQNNIPPLIDSFQRLIQTTGSLSAALKAIGTGALGFSGIGLLVSLVTSALTFFSLSARKSKDETDKLADSQKTLAQVMKESEASVQGEVATNKALSTILLDTNKSYEARNAALNQLKKTGGDYYAGLTLEKTAYADLVKASDRYTQSIIRAAAVKGLQDQISSLAGQLAKDAPIINKGFNDIVSKNPGDPFKAFGDSLQTGVKNIALNFRSADSLLNAGSQKVASDISAASDNIVRTTEAKFAKQADLQTRLKGFIDQLAATLSGTDTPDKPKVAKDVVTVTDVLADLDKQLLKTNSLFVNSGDTLQTLTNDQIKNFQNALASLIDIGVLPGDKIFDQLKSRLDDLQKVGQRVKITIPLNPVFKLPTEKAAFTKGFTNLDLFPGQNVEKPISVPIKINPDFTIPPAVSNSIFGEDLLKTHFKPQVDKFTASLNDLIQTSIETGIGSISEALGNALVTGDFKSFIGSFVNAIAGFMQKLGASLIATGVALEAFKKSLQSLQGFAAIAAGAGLILAAGAFRAIASGGIGSFATGGQAIGPQLAVIGDNPGRREAIIPSELFGKLGGMSEFPDILAVLRGQDLLLMTDRARRNNNGIN